MSETDNLHNAQDCIRCYEQGKHYRYERAGQYRTELELARVYALLSLTQDLRRIAEDLHALVTQGGYICRAAEEVRVILDPNAGSPEAIAEEFRRMKVEPC